MDLEHISWYASRPAAATPRGPDAPAETVARRFFTTRADALFHVKGVLDQARNLYVAVIQLRGNDTPIHIRRYNEHAQQTGEWVVRPAASHKADSCDLLIGGADGRSLIVLISTHQAISGERDNDLQVAELPGVVLAGAQPAATEYDSRALGEGNEPMENIDYGRIRQEAQAGAAAEVNRLVGLFGGGSVRGGLEEKAKDALVELVTQDDERGRAFRGALLQLLKDGLYQWSIDRAYEGARAALQPRQEDTP